MRASLGNLGCRFFPFITLNISCHAILGCRVSAEKSADKIMGVPFYVISFPLLLLIFSFVFNFCQFDYHMSRCVHPWVYLPGTLFCFLDLGDCFLSHVREVFSNYLFKYFLRSFLSLLLLGML